MTAAAFFDLDGTLCTGHVWKGLSRYCLAHKLNLAVYYPFIISHIFLGLLHKARLLPESIFLLRWGNDMPILLRGLSRERGQEVCHWVVEREIMPTLREDVLELMRWHQAEGHTVVLVSGAFQEILDEVASRLDVRYAIGTALEIRRRHYTGRVKGLFCFGKDKARLLRDFLEGLDDKIDLDSSYSYATVASTFPCWRW